MSARWRRYVAFARHARAQVLLVGCGVVIGLVLAAGSAFVGARSRVAALADAERSLANLSFVLAEQTDAAFRSLELVELGLIEHMQHSGIDTPEQLVRQMSSSEVHLNMRDRIGGLPHAAGLVLLDRDGKLLNFTRTWPVPDVSGTDRDFFQALRGGETVYVGRPERSRIDGTWMFYIGRRFDAPDGGLIGIVVGLIRLDDYERFLSNVALDKAASLTLQRRDGVLLVRYPPVPAADRQSYDHAASFQRLLQAVDHGVVHVQSSIFDHQERLVAPRSLTHYPLVVTVSTTVQQALEAWRSQSLLAGGGIAAMELLLAGLVLLGLRQLQAQGRLSAAQTGRLEADAALRFVESELQHAEERERSREDLYTQALRFELALDNMLQGLCMYDDTGTLVVVNRRFSELFGLPPGSVVPGMSFADVTMLSVSNGVVPPADREKMKAQRKEMLARGVRATFTWELATGRVFTATHQPMAGGWLTVFEDITERRLADARIVHLARHDALTDLPNRVLFREKLERALVHLRRGKGLALHYLDLDQFKTVNDTLGHPIGDALLQLVSERLCHTLRDTDTVARLGGDEFAIVQTEVASPVEATAFAERMIGLIERPFEVAGHKIVIGSSIGIAFAPQDGLDPDQLLKCADLALYRAKADGRGVWRLFHAAMDAAMQVRRALELDLRQALHAGQLELFYQPVISVRGRQIVGFEALLRWRHPVRGLVPPDQFIPLAEETGLIVPIGEWVLREACAAAALWPDRLTVAVNLSAVQFNSCNLVPAIAAALRSAGLRSSRLELEITETVLLRDTEATLATLHQIRDLGVDIAMDDFGTGYSSLSYLWRFPFHRIKIDQSFVRRLGSREDCTAIVRSVTALGLDLRMAVTAEGVETQPQFDALARIGCTDVQGFLFSPAVPGPMVIDLVRTLRVDRDASADPEPVDVPESAAARELVARELVARELVARELATREMATRGPATRDLATRGPATREPATREAVASL
jgi:diguanylate cyclase (GGDEF)-like protein